MADPAPKASSGMTWEEFLKYERAPIMDAVRVYSGLTGLNIVNSIYAVPKPELRVSDIQYCMFDGTNQRLLRPLVGNDAARQEVDRIVASFGLRGGSNHNLDTYYGQLIDYAWHDKGSAAGAHFTPIYGLFEQAQVKFPAQREAFAVIRRRLVFLEILESELKFILTRFDPARIPKLPDWLANKFESFASQAAETLAQIAELHFEIRGEPRPIRFEEILDDIGPIHTIFQSINKTLELLLVMLLRNKIVHGRNSYLALEGDRAVVRFRAKPNKGFGTSFHYLEKDVLSEKVGRDVGEEEIGGTKHRVMVDPRFDYVTFRFPRAKGGTWSVQNALLDYEIDLLEFGKIALSSLYHLANQSTRTLLEPKP